MALTTSIAARGYATTKPLTAPKPDTGMADTGFGKIVSDFAATLQNGENAAKAAIIGGVDPHSLVQALAQTELAVETAVTVRDKVVEAYQEILRMPV